MLIKPYYIYRHIRPDKDEVFYIGKGKYRRGWSPERAESKYGRNKLWHNVVNKNNGNYTIDVMMEFSDPRECSAKEIELISFYGRKNLKAGTLVNLTDGGERECGYITTEETKQKLSKIFSGANHPNYGKKLSAETCRRKSISLSGANHFLSGKTLPKEWVENIRKTKIGKLNPMYDKKGRLHHGAKKVIDIENNIIYQSLTEAAKINGYKLQTLGNMLTGSRKNSTNLRYL